MKLIIQIPCYNEEKTLPLVIKDLPKEIQGIDIIEYLVIDDGSNDKTYEVAKELGVHHIIKLKKNMGLINAFKIGIDYGLKLGADIIVNTDGDNQYNGKDIPKLVQPILKGEADIVVGERPIDEIPHFSLIKKKLQHLGSAVVRLLSHTNIPDTTSGFRAFSKEALLRLNLVDNYTYTIETIIQAGRKKIPITSVKIRVNPKTRESRLIKSIPNYIIRSLVTMIRTWLNYSGLKIFVSASLFFLFFGFLLGIRFLYFYFIGDGRGHIQSLILMSILFFIGFHLILIGLLADMISTNRKLIEDTLFIIKEEKYKTRKGKDEISK